MPMHRTNKSRHPKGRHYFDPVTGKKKLRPILVDMPWFSKNRRRVRRRRDIAKLSRRINRAA